MSQAVAPPTGREARLWRAVAGLAETPPSEDVARRQPANPGYGEKLVFEFDEAYTAYVDGFETLPAEAQLIALQAVDTQVSSMVRAKDVALWTEAARREDPEWLSVRSLATRVLNEFDWPSLGSA